MSWFKKDPIDTGSKVEIHFKSGSSIVVMVDKLIVTRNEMNKITKLKWANVRPNLMYISIEDIVAIVEL